MENAVIRDKAVVLKMDDVSTDHIIIGRNCNLTDPTQIAEHVLEGVDSSFRERFKTVGKILVTGNNFACGSSREHAVIVFKSSGVKAVICGTAARIWYRNAINLALPVIICPGFVNLVSEGDELEIDCKTGVIKNLTQKTEHQGQPLPEFVLNIMKHGGIKPLMLAKHKTAN